MEIILPEDFCSTLKNQHLLLDTCVFIEASINPSEFGKLFDKIKQEGHDISENIFKLIELYKEDGKTASIVDLMLGAFLMQYGKSLYLLTKNTSDFPTNTIYRKSIQSYGVYNYEK